MATSQGLGPDADRRVHYPDLRKGYLIFALHWTVIAVASGVALLFFPQLAAQAGRGFARFRPWLAPLLGVSLVCAGYYFNAARAHYLITSAEGVEYRRGRYRVRAPWRDVQRIERRADRYGAVLEGLMIRHAGPAQAELRNSARPQRDFIPLSYFSDWREGPLGDALRTYKPDLFDIKGDMGDQD